MKISNFLTKVKNNFFCINPQPEINNEEKEYSILIRNLSQNFRKFKALDNVNIKVNKGEIHAFIGPNGAGKTTTIKALIGAIAKINGDILINNYLSSSTNAKKLIGYIPESARFPKNITTWNYLVSMAKISGLTHKEAIKKSTKILQNLDLYQFKRKDPNGFSSGMRKKLLLAQALINNPEILILDEPAANLDPTARTELFNELKKLSKEGKTVFISSHILSELQNFVDSYTILNHGKVVHSGKMQVIQNGWKVISSNNLKLEKLLLNSDFNVEHTDDALLIKETTKPMHHDEAFDLVETIAKNQEIKIYGFLPHTIDLQKIYEETVIDSNRKDQ